MKLLLYFVLFLFISQISCSMPFKNVRQEKHKFTNHLIHESSPYLLQHAHNPVNWYPWGEEALEKAKRENKMLIISIGYAACHWCHVMEHESFEDTTVAKMMNDYFVCIKVDREERPDVDDVYMTACQLSSQRGCGWPLNSFALPDGRPVWAGTYFPKKQWMNVLRQFADMQKNEIEKLEAAAASLTGQITTVERIEMNLNDKNFKKEDLDEVVERFIDNTDFNKGGGKRAPKFPMPNSYQFLLKYYDATKDAKVLRAVTVTLDNMAAGGIYDQLGGGFARYSTDMDWKVPHFEKMLYDNGQLVSLYAQAFQVTRQPRYREVVAQTLDFIARKMTAPNGGFYSSLDADSDGEEGKFYVWTKAEIDSVITDVRANKIFCDFYNVTPKGNWEAKKNILFSRQSIENFAREYGMESKALREILEKTSKTLLSVREKRNPPALDDKILTSWNALMLKGYIDAYKAFGEEEYRQAALKNANFIVENVLHEDGRLNRNYKDGKSVINGFLDDYAFTITAFTALYEITFDKKWLDLANTLAEYVQQHFYDDKTGMYFYTSDIDPALVARKMELTDNVIPGSNSAMARSLYRLGRFLDKKASSDRAEAMLHNMKATITGHPSPRYYSNWCSLYFEVAFPAYEMVIMGDDFESKQKEVLKNFIPNVIVAGGKQEGDMALLKNRLQQGKTLIYVCQDKACKFPVTDVEAAMKLLNR